MRALLMFAAAMVMHAASAQEPVRLYAAGSLRVVMNDIAAAFAAATGVRVAG
jgi:ABC-type molybdate transport system substrate-binding protein